MPVPYRFPDTSDEVVLREQLYRNFDELDSAISVSSVPVGAPIAWPSSTAPTGWLICDGSAVPAGCPILTSIYGANLPNLKGRVLVGYDAAQTEFNTLGGTGGEKTHTLGSSEVPNHGHTVTDPKHDHFATARGGLAFVVKVSSSSLGLAAPGDGQASYDTGGDAGTTKEFTGLTVDSTAGGGGAHNNLQPYSVFNYIVQAA